MNKNINLLLLLTIMSAPFTMIQADESSNDDQIEEINPMMDS